jgi:hypothetical protein
MAQKQKKAVLVTREAKSKPAVPKPPAVSSATLARGSKLLPREKVIAALKKLHPMD